MKFEKITGSNFKNYTEVDFEPKKTTTAIIGPNGRGKTTITQLIRFALTGDLPDDAVKVGTDELKVTLSMHDSDGRLQTWERTKSNSRPSKVKVNGKNSTAKALSAHIESITGVPIDSLKLSSSSELIDALKPEEFSNFIMNYIPEELDYEIIKDFMGSDVDELVLDTLEKSGSIPLTGKFGYEQLEQTYNYLFEQRKLTRSTLAQYEAKTVIPVDKPTHSLTELNDKLEKILKDEGGYANALKAVEAYKKAVDAKQKQEIMIKDLEDRIAANTAKKPDPSFKTAAESKKRELNSSMIALHSTVNTMKANIETFKNTIANLNKPMCPLSEGLVCKTDKTAKKQEFEEQIQSNQEGIKTISAEIEAKKKELDELLEKERKYNEEDKLYREKVLLMNQLDKLKKSLISLPAKPEEPKEHIDFTEEKEKIYKERNDVVKYDQYIKDLAKLTNLRKEKEILDELVKLFAPKGDVSLKVTKHYFGVFEDMCNERANELKPGFSLHFIPENGIKVMCEPAPGRGYIPYKSCSSGEQAFVIFLLTDLISNALSKSNILILDDLDKLDNDAFEALIKCVMQEPVQDSYDHIIICAVNHEDTKKILDKYTDIEQLVI